MITFERGKTKKIQALFYDQSDVLTDVDAGKAKIAITFQDGTSILAATAMTKSATGTYYYLWTPLSTTTIGLYHIEITGEFTVALVTQYIVQRDSVYITDIISGD